jgi:hypothetical protein
MGVAHKEPPANRHGQRRIQIKILHLFSDCKWTGPAEHAKKKPDGRLSSTIHFQCFSEIPSFALLEKITMLPLR